jgi:DNA-binding transcriptional MerR regulator
MEKSPEAFRTIREVADAMDLPQHVLRFWETRFPQIRPLKRAGGRRYYRPDDIERLRLIKRLLYDEGYTIKGVQKLFKEQGAQALSSGAFAARLVFDAPAMGDHIAAERDPSPTFEAAAQAERHAAPPTPSRSGASGMTAGDLAALRDCLENIRQAERILMLARQAGA